MRRLILLLLFFFPCTSLALDAETISYLRQPPVTDWAAMALGRNGIRDIVVDFDSDPGPSATDFARRILAVVAQGEDPRAIGGRALVEELKGFFDGNQIGSVNLLNDDTWGIIALRAAEIPSNDEVIVGIRATLHRAQQADGCWGFATTGPCDIDSTAAVLIALREADVSSDDSAIVKGRAYFDRNQNSDGGYGFQVGQSSNSATTAWVVWAKRMWGIRDERAEAYLTNLKLSDGSFKWRSQDATGSKLITAYVAIALSVPVVASISPLTIPTPPVPIPYPLNPNPSPTPLRLVLDRGIAIVGEPIIAWVEANRHGVWEAVEDAVIHIGSDRVPHNQRAGTRLIITRPGFYPIRAEGVSYIPSPPARVLIKSRSIVSSPSFKTYVKKTNSPRPLRGIRHGAGTRSHPTSPAPRTFIAGVRY